MPSPRSLIDNAANPVSLLQQKIETAEAMQSLMKSINGIIHDPRLNASHKYAQVAAEYARHRTSIEEMTRGAFSVTSGFPRYALINNAANIRRMRTKLGALRGEAPRQTVIIRHAGGRMEDKAQDACVRIYYDKKPGRQVQQRLKENGFTFVKPLNGWEQVRSEDTRLAAMRVTGEVWPARTDTPADAWEAARSTPGVRSVLALGTLAR